MEKVAAEEHEHMLTVNKRKREEQNARILKEYNETHAYNVNVHDTQEVLSVIKDPIGNPEKMDIIAQKIKSGEVPEDAMRIITQRKPISRKLERAIMASSHSTFEHKAEVHNSNYSITPEYIENANIGEVREMYPYLNKQNKAVVLRYTGDKKLFDAALRVLAKETDEETKRWIAVNAYQNNNITIEQKQKLASIDSSAASLVKMESINSNLREVYNNAVREKKFQFDTRELEFNSNYISNNNLSQFDVNVLLNQMHDSWRGEIINLRGTKRYIYDPDSPKYYL